MQITFLVNDPGDIQPSQTTAMLMAAAVARGHRVGITGVGDLSCRSDCQPWAQVRFLEVGISPDLAALMGAIAQNPPTAMPLIQTDLLLLRTNPARDLNHTAAHSTALALARHCQSAGVRVINQPDGLIRAATKLYLLEFPEFTRPETLVSQTPAEILDFLQDLNGPAVLKPLQGTRGNDVFVVASPQDKNLRQIIDVIRRQGLVMVQRCIPGAEAGDTRVVVFNGQVLMLNGQPAAIQRVPPQGDFRSNLHAGGRAEPGIVTAAMAKVVAAIGPKLLQDGLFLAGLDFIGSQLVEINVFSTGGLRNAEQFTGEAFASFIIDTWTDGHLP
ncbi:MAG: hypothetical protein O3A14_10335 [Cyanobacteria bacterium]|nr:hypothetical protein [Cyanobacteriota bacterium]